MSEDKQELICPKCGNPTLSMSASWDYKTWEPISAYRSCYSCEYETPRVRTEDQANLCVVMGIEKEFIPPIVEEPKKKGFFVRLLEKFEYAK